MAAREQEEAAPVADLLHPPQTVAQEAPPVTSTRTLSPQFTTPAEREAATNFLINFVGGTCSVFTITNSDEARIACEALRMAEHHRASLELQAASTNETTIYPQNYVLLDGHVVELPGGIDPSFLGALPDSLRKEVVMEQLRVQGIDIRNRPIPVSAVTETPATGSTGNQNEATAGVVTGEAVPPTTGSSSSNVEINPEFLAALPPQIQEELLTQQRIEQQARAAATAGQQSGAAAQASGSGALAVVANADDDNTAFMRALPASLRQAILLDMDVRYVEKLNYLGVSVSDDKNTVISKTKIVSSNFKIELPL